MTAFASHDLPHFLAKFPYYARYNDSSLVRFQALALRTVRLRL